MGPDGRHVEHGITKSVMPLHIHVVVLPNTFNAKCILPKTRVDEKAQQAKPAVVVDAQDITNDQKLEEKSRVPAVALEKMLAMLGDLSEYLRWMESSKVNRHRKDSTESRTLGSAL